MKTAYLLTSVLFSIFISGVSVVAQSSGNGQGSAKAAERIFRANEGFIVNPMNPKTTAETDSLNPESNRLNSAVKRKPPANTTVSPGESPLFVLHSTNQFVRYGETVTYSLVALQEIRQRICVYGQVLKPGPNMYYDGTYPEGYFSMESGSGGCVSDVDAGSFLKTHTRTVNPEDLQGTLIINLVITDGNGQLLQQIISDLYIVQGGPFSLMQYVGRWKVVDNQTVLYGRFPTNVPIYYYIGVKGLGFAYSAGPDQAVFSSDRGRLVLPLYSDFTNSTTQDFMGWDPVTRQAIISPNIIIQPR